MLGNVEMVCLITKVETNRAIQKPQWNNQIHRQGKQATKTKKFWQTRKKSRQQNKRKKQKSNQLNTVSTEHIAQTTQSTNKSEENKEQRANNTITTRTDKWRTTGCREQERRITDPLCYGCGSKEHKIKKMWKEKEDIWRIWIYGEVKRLKLRLHQNNTRNEAIIRFSNEEEARLAITEINTYKEWKV